MSPDPDGTILLIACVVSFFCLLLYGVFSAAQVAMERVNDKKLAADYSDRPVKREKVLRHMERPQWFLSTVALVRLITSALPAVCLCATLAPLLAQAFSVFPFPLTVNKILATAVILAAMLCVWLFLGNLIPRKLAANTPEKTLMRTMGMVNVAAVLLRPVTFVFTAISNGIVRAMGKDPNLEDKPITEEEIRRLVDESEEGGEIAEIEADMIDKIFDFHDRTVSKIMTHRTNLEAVEDTACIQDVVNLSVEKGHSRIPVYHGDLDTIVGIVYVKDLLKFIGRPLTHKIKVTQVMRKPYLVPESKAVNELFEEMTEKRIQIAVVIDEYGGTNGIVTMEDILESIVGKIQDEYDHEEDGILQISDTIYRVDGSTPVDEVEELLEMELPKGDYNTIAGMVVEMLGNVPDVDETPSVMVENVEFRVLEFEENQIEKILIEKHVVSDESDGESSS